MSFERWRFRVAFHRITIYHAWTPAKARVHWWCRTCQRDFCSAMVLLREVPGHILSVDAYDRYCGMRFATGIGAKPTAEDEERIMAYVVPKQTRTVRAKRP
jgi:hypothetical protein